MKILKSQAVSPFGGINFVIKEVIELKINTLLIGDLPSLPTQSQYNWFDIFMSYWSVFFCGGDCAEDLSINIKKGLHSSPYIKIPSPDRILERIKSLSDSPGLLGICIKDRGRCCGFANRGFQVRDLRSRN